MEQPIRPRAKPPFAAAAAAGLATLAAGGVTPATASEIQDAYYAHTKLCIGLLFNDKPAHTEQCLPNLSPNLPAHSGSADNAPVIVVAPPPAPVVVPPVQSYPQNT